MATTYDTLQFLLDRANIHDTVNKMTYYIDTQSTSDLADKVYAPNCTIDYTAMMGGEPAHITNKLWAEATLEMLATLSAWQHATVGIVIWLPQPSPQTSKPDTASVVVNTNGHSMNQDAEGGKMFHNGGRYEFEMVRLKELEEKGENPWRISKHKAVAIWSDGNPAAIDFDKMGEVMKRIGETS